MKSIRLLLGFLTAVFVVSCQSSGIPEKCIIILRKNFFKKTPFKQSQASTIAELKAGGLIAAWFGGSYEGSNGVGIWASV